MSAPSRAALAAALDAAEDRWLRTPMRWGACDCGIGSVADFLRDHVFGYDPAYEFRGHYKTLLGLRRRMKRLGYRDLAAVAEAFAARAGLPAIAPGEGQPGDLGVAAHALGQTCLLCRGGGFWSGRGAKGLVVIRAASVTRAWNVLPEAPR